MYLNKYTFLHPLSKMQMDAVYRKYFNLLETNIAKQYLVKWKI